MFETIRRIVTGHNAAGKSVVAQAGPPPGTVGVQDAALAHIWATGTLPEDNATDADGGLKPLKLQPETNGVRALYFVVHPEDPAMDRAALDAATAAGFEAIGSADARVDTARHPGMHKTRTIDFVILLKGQVTLLLEEGEVTLNPYDVVVQRGTNHAWVNRGTEPALCMGILVDAKAL
ncbi:cupin domain-containing protein [Zavarzinia sp. CC-PAN008]|uniref:cupin domain-containing protein n=1 Tax=Zavarzinia sp. CC-PAN008 TaxID=3243332 RepID=UPI003F742E6A